MRVPGGCYSVVSWARVGDPMNRMTLGTVVATAVVVVLGGPALCAAADKGRGNGEASALLGEALRRGEVDPDTAATITRWILEGKDDAVARGLAAALRSTDLTAHGREAQRWNGTVQALGALLESALADASAHRRRDAGQWPELAALVGAAAPAIAATLQETSPSDRESILRFVQAIAPAATPMVQPLIQGLRHEQAEVRRGAAAGLGAMGAAGRGAKAELERALQDPDADVRAAAAEALRRIESR